MILLIQYTLLFSSVLMLVALGGCFSEHSGVINLELEGTMVIGALGGALTMKYLQPGTGALTLVLLVAMISLTRKAPAAIRQPELFYFFSIVRILIQISTAK